MLQSWKEHKEIINDINISEIYYEYIMLTHKISFQIRD